MWIHNPNYFPRVPRPFLLEPIVLEPKHYIRVVPTPACRFFSLVWKHEISVNPVKTQCLETPIDNWTDGSGEHFHLCPDHLWEVQLAVMFGCTTD